MLELKNSIIEVLRNLMYGFNRTVKEIEGKISEIGERIIKITQAHKQKGNRLKSN